MKFLPSEISFIVNEYNTTLASQLYDNINHSHLNINHILDVTKMVIFYCSNQTRSKIYQKAKQLGIFDDIIQVQPFGIEHKMISHTLLNGIVNQPVSKYQLSSDDNISDFIVKPPLGGFGKGIEQATHKMAFNKFYQQKINKVREFRIIYCSQFDNKSECIIYERLPKNEDMIMWNAGINGGIIKPLYYDGNDAIINDLVTNGMLVLNTLTLDYIAADFVLDDNNKLYFLECNQMTNYNNASTDKIMQEVTNWHKIMFNNLLDKDREQLYNRLYKKINT